MPPRKRRNIDSYETLEEAVAALIASLEPGAELWLHHEDCEIQTGASEDDCTCIPRKLTREVAQA
jgi:hypothetical protein